MEVWPSECQSGTSFSSPWPPAQGHSHDPVTGADRHPSKCCLSHFASCCPPFAHTITYQCCCCSYFGSSRSTDHHLHLFHFIHQNGGAHRGHWLFTCWAHRHNTEAQLYTCSSQTCSYCSMSKPRASVSIFLSQLLLRDPTMPCTHLLTLSHPCPLQVPDLTHGTDAAV